MLHEHVFLFYVLVLSPALVHFILVLLSLKCQDTLGVAEHLLRSFPLHLFIYLAMLSFII